MTGTVGRFTRLISPYEVFWGDHFILNTKVRLILQFLDLILNTFCYYYIKLHGSYRVILVNVLTRVILMKSRNHTNFRSKYVFFLLVKTYLLTFSSSRYEIKNIGKKTLADKNKITNLKTPRRDINFVIWKWSNILQFLIQKMADPTDFLWLLSFS